MTQTTWLYEVKPELVGRFNKLFRDVSQKIRSSGRVTRFNVYLLADALTTSTCRGKEERGKTGWRSHTGCVKFGLDRVQGELEFGEEAAMEMVEHFSSLLKRRRTDGRTDRDSDRDPIET